jgi:hypothetical protein
MKWVSWGVSDQHGKFVLETLSKRPALWNKREAHSLAREMTAEAKSGHPGYRSKKLCYTAHAITLSYS